MGSEMCIRDSFRAYRLTGLRMRSYVPTQTSIHILGTPGDVYSKTHAQALLLKEMFEVGFELVFSTMPNVMVLPTEVGG